MKDVRGSNEEICENYTVMLGPINPNFFRVSQGGNQEAESWKMPEMDDRYVHRVITLMNSWRKQMEDSRGAGDTQEFPANYRPIG